jgi:hypothetical protein
MIQPLLDTIDTLECPRFSLVGTLAYEFLVQPVAELNSWIVIGHGNQLVA